MAKPNKRKSQPRDAIDRGTPETQERSKKRGMDTVERLIVNGRIGPTEQTALIEISAVYTYSWSDSHAKISRYGEYSPPGYNDGDPNWYLNAWQRYDTWRTADLAADVAIKFAVYRWSDAKVQEYYGLKRGQGIEIFISSLQRYCQLAGWTERRAA